MFFPQPFVLLVPRAEWWTMLRHGSDARVDMYLDITMPARWVDESHVEIVDLDLDIARLADGTVRVDDEDEFELHQRQLGYSPTMITTARETTDRLLTAVAGREEPFGDAHLTWLDLLP